MPQASVYIREDGVAILAAFGLHPAQNGATQFQDALGSGCATYVCVSAVGRCVVKLTFACHDSKRRQCTASLQVSCIKQWLEGKL